MPNGNILNILGALITADEFGDDLWKIDGNPKNESFGIPPPTITVPHDLQPQPLDLGVHEESEDEPGVDEGAPGAEVLDSNDGTNEDNEIPLEIPEDILVPKVRYYSTKLYFSRPYVFSDSEHNNSG